MKKQKKYGLLMAGIVLLVCLAIVEIGFRFAGYPPGFHTVYGNFAEIDSLIVYKNYTTDDRGIYHLSPYIVDSLKEHYDPKSKEYDSEWVDKHLMNLDGYLQIAKEFEELNFAGVSQTEFGKYVSRYEIKGSTMDQADIAIRDYSKWPYNKQGFRSIEMKKYETDRPTVLLLGDSFTWGMDAEPIYESFADRLMARGFLIYNTGISGTDPAQYAEVAKKYVPLIQPDIVVVCFYMGNDIMRLDREPKEGEPHEHVTNAGFFESNPLGYYMPPQEAYDHYIKSMKIPQDNSWRRFCSTFSITSRIWTLLNGDKLPSYTLDQDNDEAQITKKYLDQIKEVCSGFNIPTFIVPIPERDTNDDLLASQKSISKLMFEGHDLAQPQYITDSDFSEAPDFHFNNYGMKRFTDFLEIEIKERLQNK